MGESIHIIPPNTEDLATVRFDRRHSLLLFSSTHVGNLHELREGFMNLVAARSCPAYSFYMTWGGENAAELRRGASAIKRDRAVASRAELLTHIKIRNSHQWFVATG